MGDNTPFTVLTQLFVVLNHQINNSYKEKSESVNLQSLFINEIVKLGFRGKNVERLREFFKVSKGSFEADFYPEVVEMQKIVFMAYELLCNTIGPVEADDVMGNAMTRVAKTKAGLQYSPKNFF